MAISEVPARRSATYALLLALGFILLTRLWRLPAAGLLNYDAVTDWQTVLGLAHGNGQLLFHHASPGFGLLFAPLAWLTSDYRVFQVANAVVGVASLGIFGHFVSQAGKLGPAATAAVVLLAGTSLLLTSSGRDFTENTCSLGAASGLLAAYYRRLHTHQPADLLRAAAWLTLGLCFSFKLLFMVPVLLVLEWWAADGLLGQRGTWWRVLAIVAAPYVVLGAVGVLVGLPWFRWPAIYYRSIFPEETNLAGNQAKIHLEPFFYLRYLLDFEPALLIGLVVGLVGWARPAWWQRGKALALAPYLLVWAVCLLLGLSVLAKAPRALLFACGPLAALLVMGLRRLLPAWAANVGLLGSLGLNLFSLQREVFSRQTTHYPEVVAWLRTHQARHIATTAGIGIMPFLDKNQVATLINSEHQLAALRRQGYQYVLLDSYWRPTNIAQFDSLRRQRPVAAWPEPQLTAPLLFLEHAEYTGLSYDQSLAHQRLAAQDTVQLRLYRL
ncbi:MAG: hypothetical protein ACRYG7_04955 [Janthinobacterium lividum]